MDIVKRKTRKGEIIEYPIYTRDEAEAQGIPFKAWRLARGGDWVISDDGFVSTCLNAKQYVNAKGKARYCFRFPYTSEVWAKESTKVEYLPAKARFVDGFFHPARSWQDKEAKRRRTKDTIKAYAQMAIQGRINWNTLSQMFRPDDKRPIASVRRLFRQREIREMADKEMLKMLEAKGITEEKIIDMINSAADLGAQIKQPLAILKAAEHLGKILDKAKGETVQKLDFTITREISDSVHKAQIELGIPVEAEHEEINTEE